MSLRAKGKFLSVSVLIGTVAFHTLLPALALADTIKIGGTGAALGTMQMLAEAFRKSHADANVVIVPGLGSGGGRKALLGGAIDLAVTSKAGSDVEKLEGAAAVLYGRTPFVFATSSKNPVSGFTTQEIVEIYNGTRNTWADGSRIRLILRPAADSDTEMLTRISPAMEQAVKNALSREGMKIAVTDGDSADAIQNTAGGLGTSTLALIVSEKRSLKALSLNGATAGPKTIADGSYPYFKSMYIITGQKPSELTQQFVSFTLSRPAREILAQIGYWVVEAKVSP